MKPLFCNIFTTMEGPDHKFSFFFDEKGGEFWFTVYNLAKVIEIEESEIFKLLDPNGPLQYPYFRRVELNSMMISENALLMILNHYRKYGLLMDLMKVFHQFRNRNITHPEPCEIIETCSEFSQVSGIKKEYLSTPDKGDDI